MPARGEVIELVVLTSCTLNKCYYQGQRRLQFFFIRGIFNFLVWGVGEEIFSSESEFSVPRKFLPLKHNTKEGEEGRMSHYIWRETSLGVCNLFHKGQKHISSNFSRGMIRGGILIIRGICPTLCLGVD